jgi:hypothetical protein
LERKGEWTPRSKNKDVELRNRRDKIGLRVVFRLNAMSDTHSLMRPGWNLEARQFHLFFNILFYSLFLRSWDLLKRFAYQHRSHPCEKVDSSSREFDHAVTCATFQKKSKPAITFPSIPLEKACRNNHQSLLSYGKKTYVMWKLRYKNKNQN